MTRDDPVPLRDALAAVGKQLGVPAPDVAAQLAAVWADVAGDALAAHSRLRLGRGGECAIDVDSPAFATRARYLAEGFRNRANEAAGRTVVTAVNVQVKAP